MQKEEIFKYMKKLYGTELKYLCERCPSDAVLRYADNKKRYEVIMNVAKNKLGLDGSDTVDIINVKWVPDMIGSLIQSRGFLPGYHMNKDNWMTILSYETVGEAKILDFLDMSYELTDHKKL